MDANIQHMYEKSDEMRCSRGRYMPAFFEMYLNTKNPIDIHTFDRGQWSTFLHEYIHFLQDITTLYGLHTIYAVGEFIKSYVHQVKQMPIGAYIPIDFSQDNQDYIQSQMDVQAATIGEISPYKRFKDSFHLRGIQKARVPITANSTVSHVEQILLDTDQGLLHFGAREIMESMAYTIQHACYAESVDLCEFPYKAAYKVAAYYDAEFANDPRKIVALCELSLMASNPGEVFECAMRTIQSGTWKINRAEDLYGCLGCMQFSNGDLEGTCTANEMYRTISHYAYHHIIDYYKGEPRYQQIIDWLQRVQRFTDEHRKQTLSIFLSIMDGGEAYQNEPLRRVVSYLGGPLMKNDEEEYFQFDNMPDMSALTAVKTIYYDVFLSQKKACGLYKWCKQNPNNVDEDCINAPWNRSLKAETMCPFSMLWRKWGLSGHYPMSGE